MDDMDQGSDEDDSQMEEDHIGNTAKTAKGKKKVASVKQVWRDLLHHSFRY
jgi:hypothetical protein